MYDFGRPHHRLAAYRSRGSGPAAPLFETSIGTRRPRSASPTASLCVGTTLAVGLLGFLAGGSAPAWAGDPFPLAPDLLPLEATTATWGENLVALVISRKEAGKVGNQLDALLVPLNDPAGLERRAIPTNPVLFSLGRRIQCFDDQLATAVVENYKPVFLYSANGLTWNRITVASDATCTETEMVKVGNNAVLSCYDNDRGTIRTWSAPSETWSFTEGSSIASPAHTLIVPAIFGGDRHALAADGDGYAVTFSTTPDSSPLDPSHRLQRWLYRGGIEIGPPQGLIPLGEVAGPREFTSSNLLESDLVDPLDLALAAFKPLLAPFLHDLVDELPQMARVFLGWSFPGNDRSAVATISKTTIDLETGAVKTEDSGCPPSTTVPRVSGPRVVNLPLAEILFAAFRGNASLYINILERVSPSFIQIQCNENTFIEDGVADDIGPVHTLASAQTLVHAGSGAASLIGSRAHRLGSARQPRFAANESASDLFRLHNVLLSARTGGGLDLIRYDAPCKPGDTALCLGQGRFRVQVFWRHPSGSTDVAHAVPFTANAGTFWFFNPENVEIAFKLLDGTAFNGNFWTFYGSITNLEFWLAVTDTQTGYVRIFHNPAGALRSVANVLALPGDADFSTIAPGPPAAQQQVRPADLRIEPAPGGAPLGVDLANASPCPGGTQSICLNKERFAVRLEWRDPRGNSGVATPVALTSDSAYFWFFQPNNVEIVLKVLDARSLNGRFWVFYASLTNVQFTLTVTDTKTGAVKRYTNPQGQLASFADTKAFAD